MDKETKRGLQYIVSILNKNNIPYRIGGGLASFVYGSPRDINDIDISISGVHFSKLISECSEYVSAGPEHYIDEKWDCYYISLNYHGQEIDISDIDTLRMSNREKNLWFQTKDNFQKFNTVLVSVEDIIVSVIDPRDLLAYKRHLDGDQQSVDIEAIEKYLIDKGL